MADINPVKILERAGVDDYIISYYERTVWMKDTGLENVAAHLKMSLSNNCLRCGEWIFRTHREKGEFHAKSLVDGRCASPGVGSRPPGL